MECLRDGLNRRRSNLDWKIFLRSVFRIEPIKVKQSISNNYIYMFLSVNTAHRALEDVKAMHQVFQTVNFSDVLRSLTLRSAS